MNRRPPEKMSSSDLLDEYAQNTIRLSMPSEIHWAGSVV